MLRAFTLSFVFILCALYGLKAASVSVANAQIIALNFYKVTYPDADSLIKKAILKFTQKEADNTTDFYVFDITPANGFVIVSAYDDVTPIIGYSNESLFDPNFQEIGLSNWVNKTAAQIHDIVSKQIAADPSITGLWSAYKLGRNPVSSRSGSVGPLLQTSWSQSPYYNQLCPVNPSTGQRSVTGCVATAMAQIMKYWNYPAQGTGSFSYVDDRAHGYQINAGTLSANFGTTTYDWTQMPNRLTGASAAVATLMSHCGISVAMDYSDGGSGAYVIQSEANSAFGQQNAPCAQHSFITYFSYNPSTIKGVHQSSYSTPAWIQLMENELNEGRVIQYEGFDIGAGGHTWVCDGYDGSDRLHMNWGWGGAGNGYFAVNNLSVGGYSFNYYDAALIGIQPLHPNIDTTCKVAASFTFESAGGNLIQFTNTSSSNHSFSSYWKFFNAQGQFGSSALKNPLITFTGQTPYSAQLTVTDTSFGGCKDSIVHLIDFNPTTTCLTFQHGSTKAFGGYMISHNDSANSNFPGGGFVDFMNGQWTSSGRPFEGRSTIAYNLSQIPVGSKVVTAKLSLYSDSMNTTGNPGNPMYGSNNASYLQLITSPWLADSVCWRNQPSSTTAGQILLPQSTSTIQSYLDLDVSAFVQLWINKPDSNYGLFLKIITKNYYNGMIFCSTAHIDSSRWPKLEICFIPAQVPNDSLCPLSAAFTYQNAGGVDVQFTNNSTSTNPNFLSNWTFYNKQGAFATSTLKDPLAVYNGQPPYSAKLVVTDTFSNCSKIVTKTINLNVSPTCTTWQQGKGKCVGITVGANKPNTILRWSDGNAMMASQWTYGGTAAEVRSMLKFNLSQIPAGSIIINGQISLYADTNDVSNGYYGKPMWGSDNACYLKKITSPWNPDLTTWNNQPTFTEIDRVLLAQSTSITQDYFDVDITNFVRQWVTDSASNNGMLLDMITSDHYNSMIFNSTVKLDSTRWPRLEVCYLAAATCHAHAAFVPQNLANGEVQFTNSSTDNISFTSKWIFNNASGVFDTSIQVNPKITFTGNPPFSAMLIVTDSVCSDTTEQLLSINECVSLQYRNSRLTGSALSEFSNNANLNFTTFPDITASEWNFGTASEMRSVLKFDLSFIPVGSSILSAKLDLFANKTSGSGYPGQPTYGNSNASYLQMVTSPWDASTVTWDTKPAITNKNQVILPQANGTSQDYLDINLNTFVQSWVNNPSTNYGMMMGLVNPVAYNSLIFCSPAYPDSTRWPRLDVCYQVAAPCHMTASFSQQDLGNHSIQFTNTSTTTPATSVNWTFYDSKGVYQTSVLDNPLITFSGQAPFSATILVTDTGTHCLDTIQKTISFKTGINDPVSAYSLNIYPNPNNGNLFYLQLPSDFNAATTQLKVFDLIGQEIELTEVSKQQGVWKITLVKQAANGLYTVTLTDNTLQRCGKLVMLK